MTEEEKKVLCAEVVDVLRAFLNSQDYLMVARLRLVSAVRTAEGLVMTITEPALGVSRET